MKVKKVLLWTLLVFFLYTIATSPTQAAAIVQATGAFIVAGLKSIGDFFNALLNKK